MTTSENGFADQSADPTRRNLLLSRKVIGVGMVVVFAAAIVFGGVHSALEVIEATSSPMQPASGEYVPRLAAESSDDPAVAALKYVCLFH
ncbi:MAG: hypothetical protein F4W95_01855 [Chloroflexi bacterium]|nr:hypothetical protein [Chloroflexota bacterium]MYD47212.1 hypothetical protein [Chloroflexota bacterium]